jgi:hypothetical protein
MSDIQLLCAPRDGRGLVSSVWINRGTRDLGIYKPTTCAALPENISMVCPEGLAPLARGLHLHDAPAFAFEHLPERAVKDFPVGGGDLQAERVEAGRHNLQAHLDA